MKKIGFGKKSFYVMSEEEIAQIKQYAKSIVDDYEDIGRALRGLGDYSVEAYCQDELATMVALAWNIKSILSKES